MPRTIEVELTRDLTDSASPGDAVTITGVKFHKFFRKGSQQFCVFECIFNDKICNWMKKAFCNVKFNVALRFKKSEITFTLFSVLINW